MGFSVKLLSALGRNPVAFGVAADGRLYGRVGGRSAGVVHDKATSSIFVCTADGQQPILSVPSEGSVSDAKEISEMERKLREAERIVKENVQRAKAARQPAALLDIRLRGLSLTEDEAKTLAKIEEKRAVLREKRKRKEKILPGEELSPKEESQYKLLSKSRAGERYAERHGGQRLTPKQVADEARLIAQASEVATAQDRMVEALRGLSVAVPTNQTNSTWISGGAMFVQNSGNEKIMDAVGDDAKGSRNTATTYAAINPTCPVSCVQRGVACYAETSNNIRPIVLMLEHIAAELYSDLDQREQAIAVAQNEADCIDASFPEYVRNGKKTGGIQVPTDLRIHTVGDCQQPEAVRLVARAAERWLDRAAWVKNPKYRSVVEDPKQGPPKAWSYTHAWKQHTRADWGRVSVLASVQLPADIAAARARGFAPTAVVPPDYYGQTSKAIEERWAKKDHDGLRPGDLVAGRDFTVNARKVTDENGNEVLVPYFTPEGLPIPFPVNLGTKGAPSDKVAMFIPCPAQNPDPSKRLGCVSCRICFNDDQLKREEQGVAFTAHASGKVRGVPFYNGEYEAQYAESKVSRAQAEETRRIRGKVTETPQRGGKKLITLTRKRP